MTRFIPRDKLGKKARKQLDVSQRLTWGQVKPATRIFKTKKTYKRDKSHDYLKDDWTQPELQVRGIFSSIPGCLETQKGLAALHIYTRYSRPKNDDELEEQRYELSGCYSES